MRLRETLREFLGALTDPWTYSPRNSRGLLGFAWGLPLPLAYLAGELWGSGREFNALRWEHLVLLYPWVSAVLFGAMGTLRRRSELRVADATATNERLHRDERLKTRFLAFVAHDLKSPLVAIRGYTEGMIEERLGPLTERQRAGLEVSVRNIDRLQTLILQLGEFEHVDGSDFKLSMGDFDIAELIRETVADFQPRIDAGHLTVHLRTAQKLAVRADRARIGLVLTNLVANALAHSPEDAVVRIGTYTGEEDNRVLVTVADRGAGIPTAAQEHLFTRYGRPDPGARKTGGTGLGLAICKGILDAHGSSLEIVSEEGEGTTARFDLALAESRIVPWTP